MRRAFFVALPVLVLLAACAKDDPQPTRPETPPPEPTLSAAFEDNCARCHGPRGEGTDAYPRIPGVLDEATFIATVRSGKGRTMPAFDPSQISDEDLKADFAWMTTKRPN